MKRVKKTGAEKRCAWAVGKQGNHLFSRENKPRCEISVDSCIFHAISCMIRPRALFLSGPARWIEWFHFASSRVRSLALADSGYFDRRVHWIVSECGDLPRALGDVGERAEAFFLPEVSRADTDVVEHSGVELAVVARPMCEVRL
jgi:hypothetical protein